MDISNVAAYSTMQPLHKVQNAVGVSVLNKSMEQAEQSVAGIMENLAALDTKAAELSVNPNVGSMFDVRV